MEFHIDNSPTADSFYRNGLDFLTAAERCLGMREDGHVDFAVNGKLIVLVAPSVVNASFACEMFFKALILKNGMACPKGRDGHNLLSLFGLLPEPAREFIAQFCCGNKEDAEGKMRGFLDRHAEDFVGARYYIERFGWQEMSPLMVYTYAHNIGEATKYLLTNWELISNG